MIVARGELPLQRLQIHLLIVHSGPRYHTYKRVCIEDRERPDSKVEARFVGLDHHACPHRPNTVPPDAEPCFAVCFAFRGPTRAYVDSLS